LNTGHIDHSDVENIIGGIEVGYIN
jgi:hypothetical protein